MRITEEQARDNHEKYCCALDRYSRVRHVLELTWTLQGIPKSTQQEIMDLLLDGDFMNHVLAKLKRLIEHAKAT